MFGRDRGIIDRVRRGDAGERGKKGFDGVLGAVGRGTTAAKTAETPSENGRAGFDDDGGGREILGGVTDQAAPGNVDEQVVGPEEIRSQYRLPDVRKKERMHHT